MSDTLGDMLTRIRNGQTTNKKVVDAPASRFRKNVLEVLKREGFIRNFEEKEMRPGINFFEIELKYYNGSAWVAIVSDTDVKVSVSSNDTTPGFLNGKLVAGTNVSLTEGNDGGNETLTIAASGASAGFAVAMAIAL